jgi:hypothetical protein
VGLAVLLLVEGLGVERIGRSCNACENRQGNQSKYDGLHGYFSKNAGNTTLPVIDAAGDRTMSSGRAVPGGTSFEDR